MNPLEEKESDGVHPNDFRVSGNLSSPFQDPNLSITFFFSIFFILSMRNTLTSLNLFNYFYLQHISNIMSFQQIY